MRNSASAGLLCRTLRSSRCCTPAQVLPHAAVLRSSAQSLLQRPGCRHSICSYSRQSCMLCRLTLDAVLSRLVHCCQPAVKISGTVLFQWSNQRPAAGLQVSAAELTAVHAGEPGLEVCPGETALHLIAQTSAGWWTRSPALKTAVSKESLKMRPSLCRALLVSARLQDMSAAAKALALE